MARRVSNRRSLPGLGPLLSEIYLASARELSVPKHPQGTISPVLLDAAAPDRADSMAKLVYSSLDNRSPAGPRSDAGNLVQVVCNAGDYAIDLQIEPEFEAAEISLVGQVANRSVPGAPLAGAPVRLMARKKQLSTALTNDRGEFCLVTRLQKGLKLCIDIEAADLRVGIPLDKLMVGFEL